MALIKSISGIRGTIGGRVGEGLSPLDTVKFVSAFGFWTASRQWRDERASGLKKIIAIRKRPKIVIGRDARISGDMVKNLVVGALQGIGIDVIDIGLSTTPTVEVAVPEELADGGIIITASHNPKQWNALKLLNSFGEFISASDGEEVLEIAAKESFLFAGVDNLGTYRNDDSYLEKHINKILALPLVDGEAIKKCDFTIVVDCVNSTGGIFVPALLKKLGVKKVVKLYCEPNGQFPHNPEPLPENLKEISKAVKKNKADLGIVVDPDVDRLALVCEDGKMFGEEYTLVAVADYILKNRRDRACPVSTVSNLSSTRALRDVTEKAGGNYFASAVGEVNVVEMMKAKKAIIGGEGNGGIIYPELHYGRDALVGIALFLTHLAKSGKKCSSLRKSYPDYFISKNKIELTPEINVDEVLDEIQKKYKSERINTIDGVKIDFKKEWVHLRKSNTEPIIRIYAESSSTTKAEVLALKIIADIKSVIGH